MKTSLLLSLLLLALADPSSPFTGKVVSVADGDTITVLHDRTQYRIRLHGIDAPEHHQAFGNKAKQALAERVFGNEVKVHWRERDQYGRIVGDVYVNGRWVNRDMVVDGLAWHYKHFSSSKELARAEAEAKAAQRGLWADAHPVPPWEFRKRSKFRGGNPSGG